MKSAREPVDHVRVCCRVRPLNAHEQQLCTEVCVDYPSRTTDAIECNTAAPAASTSTTDNAGTLRDAAHSTNVAEHHRFTFSRVFRAEAGQAEVYEHVARPIVTDVMSGYNGTIFMYGQTGSGKTHTMFGDMKGSAWSARSDGVGAARPSTPLSAESEMNVEEEEEEGEHAKESRCPSENEEAEHNEEKANDEFFRYSVRAAPTSVATATDTGIDTSSASSCFCRARATFTPLGELRQINTLQTAAGVADYQQKSSGTTTTTGDGRAPRKLAHVRISKTQERRTRTAFAQDSVSGVIPRAVHDVFHAIAEADPSTEFDVQMFFVEIYMEQIRDLLAPAACSSGGGHTHHHPARKLQLREDVSTNSFYVDGCRMPHVSSASEVLQLVKAGLKYRATSATAMNEASSRSHCLLNLTVKSENRTRCTSTVGKLYLVDLAGSEKVGKTNATGLRLEEAKLINKSLSTLGMVIMSLTDQSATHTPYRNSVLTKILKDSLGGNSHTALVICCSPSPYNAQETLSTLRFGARAKAIENKAVVNRELTAAQLKRMLDSAKDEIGRLNGRIRQLMHADAPSGGGSNRHDAMFYDSFVGLAALTEESGGTVESDGDFPASAGRKLSNASVAASAVQDTSRISALLEERATQQARQQQLRAEAAQVQDSLNTAQETISTLQEERDGYLDRIRSYQEEIEVWEAAHQGALHRAATQDALLQQCRVLLHTQMGEINDLVKAMQDHAVPLALAKAAVESWSVAVFGPDAPSQRRHTRIAADAATPLSVGTLRPATAATAAAAALSELRTGGRSNTPEVESPNPRRQLAADLGDASIVLPQTSRSQQLQGPHTTEGGRLSGTLRGLSPAVAAALEWRSRHPSAAQENVDYTDGCPARSRSSSVQAQYTLRLEEQLNTLSEEHAALQQQHKDALAELQSKQRILELRRGRLENVNEELKHECSVNKELRERLEKEREAVRAPLEMARNDANYWRRRFEELASRRDGLRTRSSENARSSLHFVLPPPPPQDDRGASSLLPLPSRSDGNAGSSGFAGAGEGRRTTVGSAAGTSCRGSGEDVLLSLSSHSTPTRTLASFPSFAQQQQQQQPPTTASSVAGGAGTTAGCVEEDGVSPSATSKL
ncbi:putative kinesin heavy chain [Leptomonas pyrrhocoris]|uniref:Putative kinesin heavy chain n=1 Tax=Leptomonas pyrrhocoris TaxID=157538 RepID=A0A0M9FST8_LEPPY|nr:putative kinesin heavy chain [Leptomonas pyrrhocoris]KPA75335.1 putative kinesin heavy chain [Leptomonas pyrrhocoris]|eukprot:XP_015653774.1 putative kinesin heavy chain [Leptomonas pyrrhocoris]